MKGKTIGTFALLAAAFALPAAHAEEEDLDVTMQVLDDLAQVEEGIAEMRGPEEDLVIEDPDEVAAREAESGETEVEAAAREAAEREFAGIRDDFEHDDVDQSDVEEGLDDEDDFAVDEEVDADAFDEPEMPEDEEPADII